ncbi:hypothetical protein KFL_010540020 [Klebsormidium nitens]|uniref:Uncharacterized protein n=1 Tax=Klebsormidium nitens TaxID=105231 RepID=A0A1Y1IUN9_KLENI|nr:hypothetical protein KFL_010540020 [Klebsormidium nitens]|eukprot:GAQ92566.1 hypothetical protein KFL_010540020 [Klebsormidium nitens]
MEGSVCELLLALTRVQGKEGCSTSPKRSTSGATEAITLPYGCPEERGHEHFRASRGDSNDPSIPPHDDRGLWGRTFSHA